MTAIIIIINDPRYAMKWKENLFLKLKKNKQTEKGKGKEKKKNVSVK